MNAIAIVPPATPQMGGSLARKHYDAGYALYLGYQPLSACRNAVQRRGWLAANAAEAEASYAAWCAQESADYEEYMDDVEWLRGGC